MKWVIKTSLVRVATNDGERVYRSLEETPEEVREQIQKAFDGQNSQTILIANQEALDRISDGVKDFPLKLQAIRKPVERLQEAEHRRIARQLKALLIGGCGLIALLWALWLWSIRSGT